MGTGETRNWVAGRWTADGAGEHYATDRWRSGRAAGRDPRLVARALARRGPAQPLDRILDVPAGTGRLQPVLAGLGRQVVGVDVSSAMLAEIGGDAPRLQGSAWSLPFRARSFDAVVCCRLLHHVRDDDERLALLRELVRVAAGPILVSFWDARSWHAFRRRRGLRRNRRPDTRVAIDRHHLTRLFERAGARVTGFEHSFRFVSQQAFAVAERNDS